MKYADIYRVVGKRLINKGFYGLAFEDKKTLVLYEMKKYLYEKITKVNPNFVENNKSLDESSINYIIRVYTLIVPEDKRIEEINNITHYLLNIMSELQGYAITWQIEDDNQLPIFKIEENGLVDSLYSKDYETISDVQNIFSYVSEYFTNEFKNKLTRKC